MVALKRRLVKAGAFLFFQLPAQEEKVKRKDALRKVRTVCERLDKVDPKTFEVEPRQLYLFGSVLTDKPDPNNVDLLLVYELIPKINYDKFLAGLSRGRPVLEERLAIHLRRGMQKVRISTARTLLGTWDQRSLFLVVRPRLIWEPGGNWKAVIDYIEVNPTPWPGLLPADAKDQHEALVNSMLPETYEARLAQALAEIQAQQLQPAE